MGTPEPATFGTLERLAHTLVDQLRHRLQLAAVEMTEEEIRFAHALGWQLTALFLTCLTVTLGIVLLIAVYWDTPNRASAIGWAMGLVALGAAGMWTYYMMRLRKRPVAFSQTVLELARDAQALEPGPDLKDRL
jgi:uncharacterized membrane protein YqjE